MSASTAPFKFQLLDECRLFVPFQHLPPEVRHRIWEAYLTNVGVNFVKLETLDPSWRWDVLSPRTLIPSIAKDNQLSVGMDDIDLVINKEARTRRIWHAELVADSQDPRTDISNYQDVYRQLAILASICLESAALAHSLRNRPGVVKLGDGNIVTLDRSPDLIHVDYMPPEFYETNCSLDFKLDCPSLSKMRRVAVRFCHSWQPEKTSEVCRSCGDPHDGLEAGNYPTHLYQFLARYMPQLEELHLIDYFIVPRTENETEDPLFLVGEDACQSN